MHNKRPPIPAIVLLLVLISVSAYFIYTQSVESKDVALTASGFIEATQINLAPELPGKVTDVFVTEGQSVKTGDPLLRLDDSGLQSEKRTAQAALESANAAVQAAEAALASAQSQYDLVLTNALAQERNARISIWKESKPTEFDQPTWYFSKQERLQAAQAEVDATRSALDEAQKKLEETSQQAGSAEFLAVEAKLVQMRLAFQNAQDVYDSIDGASDSQDLRDAAQIVLDEAQTNLDDAQRAYDDALTTDGAKDVLAARADVVIAQEIYDHALDTLRALQTGADSPQVNAALKAVEQAQASLELAKTNVATAESRISAVETQLKKTTILAPMDGVILIRNVEPGEFVQPGATAFSMANLNDLTITVYVPEDQYGNLSLGQTATVTVDSFAGELFHAEVIHISDQAEFTPRNVQTVEGRSSTVYAIKLKVTDSEGRLKIGMPADVVFSEQ